MHYFNYDVTYVMNITDIDDKIIKRGRTNYLVEEYIKKTTCPKQILKDAKEAMVVRNLFLSSYNQPFLHRMIK